MKIDEWLIIKDLGGISRGLIVVLSLYSHEGTEANHGKSLVMLASVLTEIRIENLWNKRQDRYRLFNPVPKNDGNSPLSHTVLEYTVVACAMNSRTVL
jgi:hypothetical protein